MRTICEKCSSIICPVGPYRCKGDDECCEKVINFDAGYEAALIKAIEEYDKELTEFMNFLDLIRPGSKGLVDVKRSIKAFRKALEQKK